MPISVQLSSVYVRPIEILIPATLFTGQNQSVTLAAAGVGPGVITKDLCITDVIIYKDTPFDVNGVEIGHAATSGLRDSLATLEEVDATVPGVSKPSTWRGSGKFADLLNSGNRAIYARTGAGSVPTVGQLRLVLLVYDTSPRNSIS